MEQVLFGLTLGLMAGAVIATRCREVRSFVNDAEKTVTNAIEDVKPKIKKAVKQMQPKKESKTTQSK